MATDAAVIPATEQARLTADSSDRDWLAERWQAARAAQRTWSRQSISRRLRTLRNIRHQLAGAATELVAATARPHPHGQAEALAGQLIPLADACRFLEKEAPRILAPQRLGARGRPFWLRGVTVSVHREPLGIVLIVGASNYPLFLPGIQALQALIAGNAVFLKPGRDGSGPAAALLRVCHRAGLDHNLIQLLPEEPKWVAAALQAGSDKVVLTGSAASGRQVLAELAPSLTPATLELSGCDAVFVLPSADLERVADCLAFGMRFNDSATCIAPRRVFVPDSLQDELAARLQRRLAAFPGDPTGKNSRLLEERVSNLVRAAIGDGAQRLETGSGGPTILTHAHPSMQLLQADIFAPVLALIPVPDMPSALDADRICPYSLAAVVFGAARQAQQLAAAINAGCVVINDVIVPTADPRVPFGGRRQSGFGVTRGALGLLEMTQIKTVVRQRSRWLPHLDQPSPFDAQLLRGFLQLAHGAGLRQKVQGLRSAITAVRKQQRWQRQQTQLRQQVSNGAD